MLSETLTEGLEAYRIGAKVRALRQKKGLGVVQLGEHTGLSPAMISKIERGQLFPTLPTLLRIALVFGVGLEHFFTPDERPPVTVVSRRERLRLAQPPGSNTPAWRFESLTYAATDPRLDGYLAEFPAGGGLSAPHEHRGAEMVYLIEGGLEIVSGDETYALEAGDAAYLEPGVSHAYRNPGPTDSRAVVVVGAA
jgi:transcriptional regulator with XRE-family HTH domain